MNTVPGTSVPSHNALSHLSYPNAYISLWTHENQLLLVTLCETNAEIGNRKVRQTHSRTQEQTDVKVEIVM